MIASVAASAEPRADAVVARLVESQEASGAFPSFADIGGRRHEEGNACVTALVMRTLRRAGVTLPAASQRQALAFLASCAAAEPCGGYCFYPPARWPAWLPALPADCDDTALAATELLAADLLRPDELWASIAVLMSARIRERPSTSPPWLRTGAFGTWVGKPGVVDCTVNANVLTFLASAGRLDMPGCEQAVRMLHDAVDWAGESIPRFRSISPFYPQPQELADAARCAADAGVPNTRSVADHLAAIVDRDENGQLSDVICSSAYGQVSWRSPALAELRRINDSCLLDGPE